MTFSQRPPKTALALSLLGIEGENTYIPGHSRDAWGWIYWLVKRPAWRLRNLFTKCNDPPTRGHFYNRKQTHKPWQCQQPETALRLDPGQQVTVYHWKDIFTLMYILIGPFLSFSYSQNVCSKLFVDERICCRLQNSKPEYLNINHVISNKHSWLDKRAVRVAQWQDRFSKLTSAPLTSEVVCLIPGQTHSSCDREGDSLGQRRFSPGAPFYSYITLQIAQYRANNVLSWRSALNWTTVTWRMHDLESSAMTEMDQQTRAKATHFFPCHDSGKLEAAEDPKGFQIFVSCIMETLEASTGILPFI
jgi:hypothetical protein